MLERYINIAGVIAIIIAIIINNAHAEIVFINFGFAFNQTTNFFASYCISN